MKKILIFGGTGNISLDLTNKLKEKYDVSILNRSDTKVVGVKTIKGNVADLKLLESIKDDFDIIFDFLLFNENEAKDRIKIFSNVKQYFFISSVTVFDRENNIYIDENTKKGNPYSEYAKNKLLAEKVFEKSSINYTIIRPSQTYSNRRIPLSVKGKYCYPVIRRIIEDKFVLIHGDGTNLWSAMHSIDFANIVEKLILNPKAIREDFNVCSTNFTTFNEIYKIIAKKVNKELKVKYITSQELLKYDEYDFKTAFMGDKRYSNIYKRDKLESIGIYEKDSIDIEKGIEMYLDNKENEKEVDKNFEIFCDRLK
ncbi:NAD-dependent epimerase/dehydratase family protein [Oceanivirga miroungae]|uniref:UDP-glucose 4-epimerase n=1 Tax=Oceanivirga miroungae TaxID=1130046 RepID=A0A6I8MCB8_9FUSO|nr:NAD-dependent epimerase/dehydratase family protein [Oceanivirga miroungae]VWL85111.1 hypothetical protein OMES3154_00393 [Oceanivirga miroungae]